MWIASLPRVWVVPSAVSASGADEVCLYKKAGDTTNTWLFAAFDAPLQGEAPQMYFATITPTCVTSSYRVGKAPLVARAPTTSHLAQAR